MPQRKAYPAVPPMKAPAASVGLKALLTMSTRISGIAVMFISRTTMPASR